MYLLVAWGFGAYCVYLSHIEIHDLFSIKNLLYIFIVTPLIFWLVLILGICFYGMIGVLKVLETTDSITDKN